MKKALVLLQAAIALACFQAVRLWPRGVMILDVGSAKWCGTARPDRSTLSSRF